MKSIAIFVTVVLVLSACEAAPTSKNKQATSAQVNTEQPTEANPVVLTQTAVPQANVGQDATPTVALPTDTEQAAVVATTVPPPAAETPMATLTGVPIQTPRPGGELLIDHRSVDLFDKIPDAYLKKAAAMRIIFRHNSVGWYMSRGLDCMMNKESPRPPDCDSGIPGGQIVYDAKYNRSNWKFEFNSDECQDSAWWYTVVCFTERFDALSAQNAIDAGGFKFGFTQTAPDLGQYFFNPLPNDWRPSIHDLEALESRHPDKIVFYTTSAIPDPGYENAYSFNKQMREYAAANSKILFDIADIESHLPDGTACNDPKNGIEEICPALTWDGGHPNALGMQRLAKAFWVLMARINGWDGNPG